jgi:hypothetical protein
MAISAPITIDFSTKEAKPIYDRVVEISRLFDIDIPPLANFSEHPNAILEVLNRLAQMTDGDKIVYSYDKNPSLAFAKTRSEPMESEKESPLAYVKKMFGCDQKDDILVNDYDLITKAVGIVRQNNPNYDLDKFVREALRKAAQSEIATHATIEVRGPEGKKNIRIRSGAATEAKLIATIEKMRVDRQDEKSWVSGTGGGNVPVITYSVIGKLAKCGKVAVETFIKNARVEGSEDTYPDVYTTYKEWREKGSNPAHKVGYKGE